MEFLTYRCLACDDEHELIGGYDGECPSCGHDHMEEVGDKYHAEQIDIEEYL